MTNLRTQAGLAEVVGFIETRGLLQARVDGFDSRPQPGREHDGH